MAANTREPLDQEPRSAEEFSTFAMKDVVLPLLLPLPLPCVLLALSRLPRFGFTSLIALLINTEEL